MSEYNNTELQSEKWKCKGNDGEKIWVLVKKWQLRCLGHVHCTTALQTLRHCTRFKKKDKLWLTTHHLQGSYSLQRNWRYSHNMQTCLPHSSGQKNGRNGSLAPCPTASTVRIQLHDHGATVHLLWKFHNYDCNHNTVTKSVAKLQTQLHTGD